MQWRISGIGCYFTSGYTEVSDPFAYGMPLSLVDAKAYPRVRSAKTVALFFTIKHRVTL